MDVMDIRRMLMMIGGSAMVGPLSKYEKKVLTFSNAINSSSWDYGAIVPCSFEPKIVVFYSNSTENEHIQRGVIVLTTETAINMGVVFGNTTSGTANGQYYVQNPTASIGKYKYENGTLYICRSAATIYWHSEDTYTFEIYG